MERVQDVVLSTVDSDAMFKPDNKTNGHKGQSPYMNFKRLQMHLPNFPVPVEMIFYDLKGYLNGEFEVGTYDPKSLQYTGRAHALYETSRLVDLLPDLFPQEIYYPDGGDDNLEEEAYVTLHQKADQLRNAFQVRR